MGQAAATQCVNVAIAMAIGKAHLRGQDVPVRNPLAGNAVDPSIFAEHHSWNRQGGEEDDMVVVLSTSQLLYNANPTKLGTESVRSAAKKLAKLECAAIARTRTQTTTQGSSTSN
jgi:hypothetical protein